MLHLVRSPGGHAIVVSDDLGDISDGFTNEGGDYFITENGVYIIPE